MTVPRVVIGYHGHCFDGMCSAAAMTRLLRAVEGNVQLSYVGFDHQPGGSHVPESALRGDINAVVDFRYTVSPKLTYWFDHHQTGLINDEERAHFAEDTSGKKHFDPEYASCCGLIAERAERCFHVDMSPLAEMVHWAEIIDAARFENAEAAVSLDAPAKQLMAVLEVHGNSRFVGSRIAELALGATLEQLAKHSKVQKLLRPLLASSERHCTMLRDKGTADDGVVFFDLIGSGEERYNKFIPYWLFPDCRYSVALTAGKTRTKVSVGSNPWASTRRTHNVAEICGRYGGGGHAVVGAVSLKPDQATRARHIAGEIVAELRGLPRSRNPAPDS